MSLKHKTIVAIVATALTCPSALAVEGSDGMYYTSASEGLYASIRARFNTAATKDGLSSIVDNTGSSIGVQGTGEMAHGLEAYYRYELAVPNVGADDNQTGLHTGKSFVGLRGTFGEVRFGNHDLVEHDFVTAKTDFTNHGNRPGTRNISSSQAIHYKSPDFNGLQVGAGFHMPGGGETIPTAATTIVVYNDDEDKRRYEAGGKALTHPSNDLKAWTIAGNYAFQGFAVGASYGLVADAFAKVQNDGNANTLAGFEDQTTWGVGASYGQDNWTVATFYKTANTGDKGASVENGKYDDEVRFSVGGTVDIGATKIIVTHDSIENKDGMTSMGDGTASTFEVQYNLNSKARVVVGYTASDFDYEPKTEDDFYLGLRHDF